MENGNKALRKLKTFIKSESGEVTPDKVLKIGGLTLGLLGGMMGSDVFAQRTHSNSVDLTYDPAAPKFGAETNIVSWSWGWGWTSWSSCSCA
jgi:hypothetical protein